MSIKIDETRHLHAFSSLPYAKEKVQNVITKYTPFVDGFDASAFASKRGQDALDPFIAIGESKGAGQAWWNDDVLQLLSPVPSIDRQYGVMKPEISVALRLVSRDESFLTVNWRDD